MMVACLASPHAPLPNKTVSPVNSQPDSRSVSGQIDDDVEQRTRNSQRVELRRPVSLTLRAQGLCKPFRRRQRQDWREYYLGRRHVDALEAAAIAPHVVEHLDDSQLEQHGLPASGRS